MTNEQQALVTLIEDLRDELATEVPIRLHEDRDLGFESGGSRRGTNVPGRIGWTGLPFTRDFERYLGHAENYGYEFIAAGSVDEVGGWCRAHHPDHLGDKPTSSLCKRLVVAVVEMRQPLRFAAVQEGLTLFAARKYLVQALLHAKEFRDGKRVAAAHSDTVTAPSKDPIGDMLRRQHDEARERLVWERMRLRHPILSEWDKERERRQKEHRSLGCPRCLSEAEAA